MIQQKLVGLLCAAVILHTARLSFAADLAKFGDSVISMDQYRAALKALGKQGEMVATNPDLRKKFLDHMINSALVAELATREGFEKDPLYQARLRDVTKQLLAGEYMDRTLDKQMTPGAVRKYFDQHKLDFSKKEIRASHILVSTEEEAQKILAELKSKNSDFAALAKIHSKDKASDLGFFGRGRMAPEFEQAAFATPKNAVYPKPVHSPFGWHVIKVLDTRGDDNVEFSKVESEVRGKLRAKLQEDLVHSLREKTKITLDEQLLKNIK